MKKKNVKMYGWSINTNIGNNSTYVPQEFSRKQLTVNPTNLKRSWHDVFSIFGFKLFFQSTSDFQKLKSVENKINGIM